MDDSDVAPLNLYMHANVFLVDWEGDVPYYAVAIGDYSCDFENLEKMDLFLCNNFLLPCWVGEDDEMPELKHNVWANYLTYEEQIIEMVDLMKRIDAAKTVDHGPINFEKLAKGK